MTATLAGTIGALAAAQGARLDEDGAAGAASSLGAAATALRQAAAATPFEAEPALFFAALLAARAKK